MAKEVARCRSNSLSITYPKYGDRLVERFSAEERAAPYCYDSCRAVDPDSHPNLKKINTEKCKEIGTGTGNYCNFIQIVQGNLQKFSAFEQSFLFF